MKRQQQRQIYLEEAQQQGTGALLALSQAKADHLRKVLRLEPGDEVRVADGRGRLFNAVLQKQAAVRLGDLLRTDSKPLDLMLVLGLPKNNTMDWCVEKAVECGASRIVPVVTARSVVRPAADELEKYARRWRLIAEGALEQSERTWGVDLSAPLAWESFLTLIDKERLASAQIAFFSEGRDELAEATHAFEQLWGFLSGPSSTAVFVGPEGGFAEKERQDLVAGGFKAALLGKEVLRVETAVIAALWSVRLCRARSPSVKN